MNIRAGTTVILHTPDNQQLHGTEATVAELTPWGAHVRAPAAATGNFRALWSEMILPQDTNGHGVSIAKELREDRDPSDSYGQDHTYVANRTRAMSKTSAAALAAGYTGDICDKCGSHRMVRTGACQTCQDCGAAGSCG